MHCSLIHGPSTAKVFITFLDQLARHAERRVHVIVDRHPVHRSNHPARTRSRDDLARETHPFLHRAQHQPDIGRGYFHAPHLRHTTREEMT
ncbi:hypothetical protein ACFZC5_36450 [Nocardia gamkensis]|uniref:hypothetical protein n=1 Tax=Nocardia gamkensis TaxID=352869 RepID=UPI0036E4BB6E